jgi:hypothetical protein
MHLSSHFYQIITDASIYLQHIIFVAINEHCCLISEKHLDTNDNKFQTYCTLQS